ncbi:hypothetical protein CTAYLR_001010 [Chrysophaeum taylorii]|uniref:Uncharacterized protein n=1 Tax=Chrysophaeum taylorii TaxID=2483200 RepID=A0AAD7UFN2_9STRA|nr:hypothetical protein CTAYLR_001010 [Chrysophaeum taylorii]
MSSLVVFALTSFPPVEKDRLLLDVGIALEDGLLLPLFKRGDAVPASRCAVLAASSGAVEVAVVAGARSTHADGRQLLVARHDIGNASHCVAKVRLRRSAVWLTVSSVDRKRSVATATDYNADRPLTALPRPFRFDRAPADDAYWLNDVVVVRIDTLRVGQPSTRDGDVCPEFTASRLWPAAYDLARFLEAHLDLVRGARVLELGAGTGFVGISAAKLGAARVVLTDLPENLPRLRHNLRLNGLDPDAAIPLDWTSSTVFLEEEVEFDLVLAADCVFWPSLFDPLLATFAAIAGGPTVLLAVTHRLDRTKRFFDSLAAKGWTATDLDHPATSANTRVYAMTHF